MKSRSIREGSRLWCAGDIEWILRADFSHLLLLVQTPHTGDLRPTLWKAWTPLALANNIRACLPSALPSFFSQGTGLVIVCLSPQSSERNTVISPSLLSSQSPHTETADGVPAIVSVEALCCHQACHPISCYPWLSSGPCAFL